jgi:hypothetical protein
MAGEINLDALNKFLRFANTVQAATQAVSEMHLQMERFAAATRMATKQIEDFSLSVHSLSAGQSLMACCRCVCAGANTAGGPAAASGTPEKGEDSVHRMYQDVTDFGSKLVPFAAIADLAALVVQGAKSLRSIVAEPVTALLGNVRAWLDSLPESADVYELVEAAWDAIGPALTAIGEAAVALAGLLDPLDWLVIGAGVAIGGGGYLAYRFRDSIEHFFKTVWDSIDARVHAMYQEVERLGSVVVSGALRTAAELRAFASSWGASMRAMAGHLAMLRSHLVEGVSQFASLSAKVPAFGSIAPSAPSQIAGARINALVGPHAALVARMPRPSRSPFRQAVAAGALAIPMLAAPAFAGPPDLPRPASGAASQSLVINSSPSIVVNCGDPAEVESRVLEALRKHREALFDQWRSELKKRQRTEF